jgi:hypothetical protein
MAIKQLAHRAYHTLPEDHRRREAGKVFANGIENHEIKVALLIGGENMVNEASIQAFELQAIFLATRSHKSSANSFWGS